MIKSIKTYFLLLILGIFILMFLFIFGQQRFSAQEVKNIKINFTESQTHFLSQNMLISLLKNNIENPAKVFVNSVDLNKLERVLNEHEMIESAEVFFSTSGDLTADVKQKQAIARVIHGSKMFYLDANGNPMPLSTEYSSHLPVIYGDINVVSKPKILELLEEIDKDTFLKEAIVSIDILQNQTLELRVRTFDFKIEFGQLDRIPEKLAKYKAFIHFAKKENIANNYKKVKLNYTNQVIGSKE